VIDLQRLWLTRSHWGRLIDRKTIDVRADILSRSPLEKPGARAVQVITFNNTQAYGKTPHGEISLD
jgi:hypothetical protein